MNIELGKCPRCNSFNLDYDSLEVIDDYIYYPYTCNECGFECRERYSLDFVGHFDEDGVEY